MKAYYVYYREYWSSKVEGIMIPATSKQDAYDKAFYEEIPKRLGGALPYSAWVESVTYNNGNVKYFNTSEGNPY